MKTSDNMKKEVLFWTKSDAPLLISPEDIARLEKIANITTLEVDKLEGINEDVVIKLSKNADGVISTWWAPSYSKNILEHCPGLKIWGRIGGMIGNSIAAEAWDKDIKVITAVDAQGRLLADLTVSLILAGLHRFPFYIRQQWGGGELIQINNCTTLPQRTLLEKKVALLGFGNIAQHVSRMLKPFGCDISAYDPFVGDEVFTNFGVKRVKSLKELATGCDIFSIHAAYKNETAGIVNKEIINTLKDGALLVNTSYGELIDEIALQERLAHGTLFACLDMVIDQDCIAGITNPLRYYPNCMTTPVISGKSDGLVIMGRQIVDDIIRYFSGQQLQFEVKKISLKYRA